MNNGAGNVLFITTLTFILAIIGIIGSVIVLILVFLTTLPLRDSIYEDIFWQIGANANVIEVHKARTQFVAALEIDFFVIFEYCLTVGFFCYDISKFGETNPVQDAIDWVCFSLITVIGIGNNIHGYFVMKTIEKTFNSKCYFISRVII